MKVHKLFIYLLVAATFLMITACGGGGGGSAGSGELAIDITDAKPLLPSGVTKFFVTFTDVLVHKPGGGWISLPLTGDLPSNRIDLLQFHSGDTTELVPPVTLTSGKYTQIRLVVSEAKLIIVDDNDVTTEILVEIPSENLKTDKNFDFDVETDRAADILIDFDLSQSLVVTYDGLGTPSYKLKPVLHIVDASKAATISGAIDNTSFVEGHNATVTVLYKSDPTPEGIYEEYTKVVVLNPNSNPSPTPPSTTTTTFSIFWLVPNEGYEPPRGDYRVEIDVNSDGSCNLFEEGIFLDKGEDYTLILASC